MNIKDIKSLVQMIEDADQITSLSIEEENLKIEIKKEKEAVTAQVAPAPVHYAAPPVAHQAIPAAMPAASAPPAGEQPAVDDGLDYIKSPMVGTFYTAPNPESPVYVSVGDSISTGAIVCIIEAMKLFNEIESEFDGTIEKIMVKNGDPVEYGQPLFALKKS